MQKRNSPPFLGTITTGDAYGLVLSICVLTVNFNDSGVLLKGRLIGPFVPTLMVCFTAMAIPSSGILSAKRCLCRAIQLLTSAKYSVGICKKLRLLSGSPFMLYNGYSGTFAKISSLSPMRKKCLFFGSTTTPCLVRKSIP